MDFVNWLIQFLTYLNIHMNFTDSLSVDWRSHNAVYCVSVCVCASVLNHINLLLINPNTIIFCESQGVCFVKYYNLVKDNDMMMFMFPNQIKFTIRSLTYSSAVHLKFQYSLHELFFGI